MLFFSYSDLRWQPRMWGAFVLCLLGFCLNVIKILGWILMIAHSWCLRITWKSADCTMQITSHACIFKVNHKYQSRSVNSIKDMCPKRDARTRTHICATVNVLLILVFFRWVGLTSVIVLDLVFDLNIRFKL